MAKILIVDDAAFMRKVIRDMLAKNGYDDVTEAVDGKAIRSKDDKANVVMCSAMGQEAMVVEAVQAGIKDFIVKPFKEDRLMKAVNTILGNG